jgi:hypothetical protein
LILRDKHPLWQEGMNGFTGAAEILGLFSHGKHGGLSF